VKEREKMRRVFLIGLLLLAGCQNVKGPFAPREPQKVDDPLLSIGEQQRRGRDRYALPDESSASGPRTGLQRPGGTGNY
jgi:hypothetical protein